MWIVNVNGKWTKTENLDTVSKYIKKSLRPLKNYIDLDSQKLIKIIIEFLNSEEENISINYNFHQLKIKKMKENQSIKLQFIVYLKIPSAKKKMEIDTFDVNFIILDLDLLETLI